MITLCSRGDRKVATKALIQPHVQNAQILHNTSLAIALINHMNIKGEEPRIENLCNHIYCTTLCHGDNNNNIMWLHGLLLI